MGVSKKTLTDNGATSRRKSSLKKSIVYQVNIDPSNNMFYAHREGDCAGYNQFKIQMTNNPAFVKDQTKIPSPNTSNEYINRIQKKRRVQAMQFGGSMAS